VLELVLTNIARHKARTLATAAGIALGVATIVALLSIGSGLKRTASELVHLGRADVGIFQAGVSDPTASKLPVALARRLERRPDVASATPLLLVVDSVRADPAAIVFGMDPAGFAARRLVVTDGAKQLGGRRILVGDRLARGLGVRPGDTLKVRRRAFTVAGVYHSGLFFEDSGAVLDIADAQRLTQRAGEATSIGITLAPGAHRDAAVAALRRDLPGTQVIGNPDDVERAGANGELVGKTVTIVAALALIVGGLGVSNTMAMAVLERRRELALLDALGWRRSRLIALVLAEGVATSIIGAGIGLVIGSLGAKWLGDGLGVSAIVTPSVTLQTVWQALAIGGAIGVLGSLYPAVRASSISGGELLGGT
jgi:ABC-type lipoprotein release transport system permease subunit